MYESSLCEFLCLAGKEFMREKPISICKILNLMCYMGGWEWIWLDDMRITGNELISKFT